MNAVSALKLHSVRLFARPLNYGTPPPRRNKPTTSHPFHNNPLHTNNNHKTSLFLRNNPLSSNNNNNNNNHKTSRFLRNFYQRIQHFCKFS
jgi:hypothetical protein